MDAARPTDSGIADVLASDDPALAQNGAVLLAGNLLRHLEHHFHQRVVRQLLGAEQEYARLAEVFNRALVPCSQALGAIADRGLQRQAPGARNPGWLLVVLAALGLGWWLRARSPRA